jgi:hypothetical protein
MNAIRNYEDSLLKLRNAIAQIDEIVGESLEELHHVNMGEVKLRDSQAKIDSDFREILFHESQIKSLILDATKHYLNF